VTLPSGATKLTLPASIGVPSRLPAASNRILPEPTEENPSTVPSPPNAGVAA